MPKVLRGCGHWEREREVCCWFSHVKTFLCRFSKNTCLFNLIWVFDDNWWYSIDFLKLGHHLLKHLPLSSNAQMWDVLVFTHRELLVTSWCLLYGVAKVGCSRKELPARYRAHVPRLLVTHLRCYSNILFAFFAFFSIWVVFKWGPYRDSRGSQELPRTEPKFPHALSVDPPSLGPRWDNACPVLLGCVQMGSSLWIAAQ